MPSTINNQASTTYGFQGSSDTMTTSSNVNSIVLNDPSGLSLVKTASPTTFSAGDIIDYQIVIINNSSSYLNGVRIIDNLGGGNLAYVVGSGRLTYNGSSYPVTPVETNPLTFTLQELGVGGTMTLTYKMQVIFNLPSSVTSITNSVQGIGYTASGTINGSSSSTIQKKNSVSLGISKSASTTEVSPSESFDYIITLSNTNSVLSNIQNITDSLPTNFDLTGITIKVGSGAPVSLGSSDYSLSGGNVLTVTSVGGSTITVPAGGSTVLTITGHF